MIAQRSMNKAVIAAGSIADSHPSAVAMQLIERGGAARVVGRELLVAQRMIEEGYALRGWFVGPVQRRRARDLIKGGSAKKQQCLKKAEWMLSNWC